MLETGPNGLFHRTPEKPRWPFGFNLVKVGLWPPEKVLFFRDGRAHFVASTSSWKLFSFRTLMSCNPP